MLLHITNDLMMSGTVRAEAAACETAVQFAQTAGQIQAALAGSSVGLVIIDLQMPGLDLEGIAGLVRAIDEAARPDVVMYAQHVNIETLKNGRLTGLGEVLTRGQFANSVRQIVARSRNKYANRPAT